MAELANDRFLNFPDATNGGVVSVDRHKITGAADLFDAKGPVIGACYILLDSGGTIPVMVGRHTVITTLLMAAQGEDVPALAS